MLHSWYGGLDTHKQKQLDPSSSERARHGTQRDVNTGQVRLGKRSDENGGDTVAELTTVTLSPA